MITYPNEKNIMKMVKVEVLNSIIFIYIMFAYWLRSACRLMGGEIGEFGMIGTVVSMVAIVAGVVVIDSRRRGSVTII
jgi:hypothetical protein